MPPRADRARPGRRARGRRRWRSAPRSSTPPSPGTLYYGSIASKAGPEGAWKRVPQVLLEVPETLPWCHKVSVNTLFLPPSIMSNKSGRHESRQHTVGCGSWRDPRYAAQAPQGPRPSPPPAVAVNCESEALVPEVVATVFKGVAAANSPWETRFAVAHINPWP